MHPLEVGGWGSSVVQHGLAREGEQRGAEGRPRARNTQQASTGMGGWENGEHNAVR